MSDRSQFPYGGAGDSRAGGRSLADRFRRHADSLVRVGRSPLYARLMGAAADDIDRGGAVARLVDGNPTPPGSVAFERHMRMQLTVHDPASPPATMLAVCDDHGLPIRWETYSPPA